jgi:DUF4097 and DUF4098 domain-containing protein YvlB
MRISPAWFLALLITISLTVSAAEHETETFNYALSAGGRISLDNINGDIEISGKSGNQVQITAKKHADNAEDLATLKIKIKADADAIRIETVHEKSESRWFGNNNSGKVSYTLTVPTSANLDTISTVNGEIRIRGVSGTVKAESVNGHLDLDDLAGDTNLSTTNGGIEARFDTLKGSQRVNADTVNGRITLLIPDDSSARVSAETLNGDIDAEDFGLEVEKGGFIGKDLKGSIGNGEASIDLDTVNGGIRISKRSP